MTHRATVICDASFCHKTRSGGWAVWINVNYTDGRHENHVRIKQAGQFKSRPRSSEHAEQMACLIGIWFAVKHEAQDVLVQTDCLSLVQTMGYGTSKKNRREYLDAQLNHWPNHAGRIQWRHVKGHNLKNVNDRRTYVNDWCDKQAKRYMRAQRDGQKVDSSY